jgi:hypothetical protein
MILNAFIKLAQAGGAPDGHQEANDEFIGRGCPRAIIGD